MTDEAKVACRTPAEGRDGVTNIPAWKYTLVRDAILEAMRAAGGDGLLNKDIKPEVEKRLSAEDLGRLGKLGWHVVTVKLNMEVEGELRRAPGRGPLRMLLAG